jgi:hypothetical protein
MKKIVEGDLLLNDGEGQWVQRRSQQQDGVGEHHQFEYNNPHTELETIDKMTNSTSALSTTRKHI